MFASLPSENITFSPINLINPQQKYDQLENQKMVLSFKTQCFSYWKHIVLV